MPRPAPRESRLPTADPVAAVVIVPDPRPRSRPQLIVAAILYGLCLAALAVLGIWG